MSVDTPSHGARSRAWVTALFVGVVIFGVFVRFYGLGEKLLWHDEVATRIFAAGYTHDDWKSELLTGRVFDVSEVQRFQRMSPDRSVLKVIGVLAKDDPHHPPLYYVLACLWATVAGVEIGPLRGLSVLFGLAMLPGLYWLARELGGDRRVGQMAVALGSVSPFFILYSQEAREYSLWALTTVLASAALLRGLRSEVRSAREALVTWAPYTVATVAELYTSFSSAWVILAHITYVLIRYRFRLTRMSVGAAGALFAAGVAVLPWAVNLIRNFEVFEISMRWSKEIVIPNRSLLRLLALNTSRTIADFWPDTDTPLSYVVVALATGVVVWSLVAVARNTPITTSAFILALVGLPIGLLLVPDLVFGGIRSISMKYLTPAWVGVLLALAFALAGERKEAPPRAGLGGRVRAALAVAVLVTAAASAWSNARQQSVWTKGLSFQLPAVAAHVNRSKAPLVVGNLEHYNPGNMLALSVLLAPDAKMQFLNAPQEEVFALPPKGEYGDVYLYSPIGIYREALEKREGVRTELLEKDVFLELYRVEYPE
ncbi:MAG: glycosyltransferase family 39 protein [Polyangiaceae bacterium]